MYDFCYVRLPIHTNDYLNARQSSSTTIHMRNFLYVRLFLCTTFVTYDYLLTRMTILMHDNPRLRLSICETLFMYDYPHIGPSLNHSYERPFLHKTILIYDSLMDDPDQTCSGYRRPLHMFNCIYSVKAL